MARKDRINEKNLDNLRNKSAAVTYGVDEQLQDENIEIRNIVQQTIIDTKKKLGERTNEKPINYFNEINYIFNIFLTFYPFHLLTYLKIQFER